MGQHKITIELTEYQARMLRWALVRATIVSPRSFRNGLPWKKLLEATQQVLEATDDLPAPPEMLPGTTRR